MISVVRSCSSSSSTVLVAIAVAEIRTRWPRLLAAAAAAAYFAFRPYREHSLLKMSERHHNGAFLLMLREKGETVERGFSLAASDDGLDSLFSLGAFVQQEAAAGLLFSLLFLLLYLTVCTLLRVLPHHLSNARVITATGTARTSLRLFLFC